MKKLLAWLPLLFTGVAFAYPIDVNIVTRGLDVTAESIEQRGTTIIHLENHEPKKLRCELFFNAGAESRRRNAILEPGGGQTVQFSPLREVVRMRVRIECEEIGEAGEAGDEE